MDQDLKDKRINEVINLFTSGMLDACIKKTRELISLYYPQEPFLFNLLGVANGAEGNFEEAIISYKEALSLNPQYFEVYNNIGVAYTDWGKPDLALEYLEKALDINPKYAEAFNNIGNAKKKLSDIDSAIESYKKAIELNPEYVDAVCNLGICFVSQKKHKDAIHVYEKGLASDKNNSSIKFYLADCLFNMADYESAKKLIYQQGTPQSLNPGWTHLLAKVLHKTGSREAWKYYRKSLMNDEELEKVLTNMGVLLFQHRKLKCAKNSFLKAIKLDGNNYNARLNLSYIQLLNIELKNGWANHEYRWRADFANDKLWPIQDRELWQGQDGKKLLLWKEQGIGDDILFLGLVMEAYKRTRFLTVYTDSRLISLCERGMPGVVFKPYKNKIDDEDFDYHLPMGSLPRLFRSDIKDFENTVTGYLKADKERVESLREELGLGDKKVVGISWKSIKSLHTQKKSLSLKEFGTLFKDLDIVLLNLQYGDVDNEIKEFTKSTGIEVLQCGSVDNREDLDGLAALIELCDLVVSTSNVTVHLAGALGKETWVLLPYVANFWWLLDRTDSIWYPTLRLYRQKKFQDWSTIPQDVKRDLERKFFS